MPDITPTWEETQGAPATTTATTNLGQPVASPGGEPSWDDTEDAGEKYGSIAQQAITTGEGLARGASLGASDYAETRLGLSTPEAIKGRMQENPVNSTVSQIGGGAALIGLTGGTGALAEGAGAAGAIGASALEGGVLGAGNAASDIALNTEQYSNPNLIAQKVMSDFGTGALLGGGLGVLAKGAEYAIPKATESVSKALRSTLGIGRAASEDASPISVTMRQTLEGNPASVVSDVPTAKTGVQPTSYQEIADRVAAAKAAGTTTDLPQKEQLLDAISRVEMENPIHPLQVDSLSDQAKRDAYNTYKEMPGGEALADNEAIQKQELTAKNDSTIQALAPNADLTPDAVEGGNFASKAFTEQYQNEKNALKPIFEQLKATPLPEADALAGVVNKMSDAVPGVAKMFDTTGAELEIKPYSTAMDIDQKTYTAVKQAVNALQENPSDFETLASIRRGLDQNVDVLAQGQGPGQIRALKAAMMDYMQDAVQKATPDVEVRDAFKRWAINEQERNVIEKTFGASVGNSELGLLSKVKPEQVGDKIFANTANVAAAKKILPRDKFNQILGNWLSEARAAATDKGAFSSNKFGSFLRRNQDSLNAAFSDNPAALQRLKDINMITRILPDAPSINPSGTAKTLAHALKNTVSWEHAIGQGLSFLKDATIGKVQQEMALSDLNQQLAGKARNATVASRIADLSDKVGKQISRMTSDIFENNSTRGATIASVAIPSLKDFDDKTKKISALASNPQAMMDHVSKVTQPVVSAAPDVAQGMSTGMVQSISFLNSKIPRPATNFALQGDWQPSKSQIDKFSKYYEAVNDPLSALAQVKNGSLSNEMLEGLNAVHPDLLQEMQKQVMGNITHEKAKTLNYGTKLAISKFIGQPLDQSMLPQAVQANQAAINGPDLSQQGQAQAPQGARTRQRTSGFKSLNLADRALTETQELEQPTS